MRSEELITIIGAIIALIYFIKWQISENADYVNYSITKNIMFVFFNGLMIVMFGVLFIIAFTALPILLFDLLGGGM